MALGCLARLEKTIHPLPNPDCISGVNEEMKPNGKRFTHGPWLVDCRRGQGSALANSLRSFIPTLSPIALVGQCLDVVDEAIKLPLPSTLLRPRRVNWSSRFLPRRLPNSGSTVAKRRVIIVLPKALSIFTVMRSV